MYQEFDYSKIEFVIYARKSSEQDERQALSIDSQIEAAYNIAKYLKITIQSENILKEAKSAKKSCTRPVFEEMIKRIQKRKIQGIITWHPDRLSRNAGDAGRLVDLMDEEKIKCIAINNYIFKNTPYDKRNLTTDCAQAKAENDYKGENVKRGLLKKRQLGYIPSGAKIGYMNDKGEKGFRKIIVDKDRFPIVKKLFEMFLTGKYSVRELHRIAVEEMGLTTTQRKRIGGKPIKLSSFYTMLVDPFYAGFFMGKDENGIIVRYKVNESLPRVITEEQHRKIRVMIQRKNNPRPYFHKDGFPYKRFMKCGECGGSVTASKQVQIICSKCKKKYALAERKECPYCGLKIERKKSENILTYIRYYCCNKKPVICSRGSVVESNIDGYLLEEFISKIAISPELSNWCINSLKVLEQKEEKDSQSIEENWIDRINKLERQKSNLVTMCANDIIDSEELIRRKLQIDEEISAVGAKLGLKEASGEGFKSIETKFNILTEIRDIIKNGGCEEKKEALSIFGSNLTLTKKKLSITNDIFYSTLQKGLDDAKSKNPQFEPENISDTSDRNEVFEDIRPIMLPG